MNDNDDSRPAKFFLGAGGGRGRGGYVLYFYRNHARPIYRDKSEKLNKKKPLKIEIAVYKIEERNLAHTVGSDEVPLAARRFPKTRGPEF